MTNSAPNPCEKLFYYRSDDEKAREIALVILENEIYKHLRNGKVPLDGRDLDNVVGITIERLETSSADIATWEELVEKAKVLAQIAADEEF